MGWSSRPLLQETSELTSTSFRVQMHQQYRLFDFDEKLPFYARRIVPDAVLLQAAAEMRNCQEHCILGRLLCLSVRYNQHNMPLRLCSHHCPSKMLPALSSLSGGVRNCQVLTAIHWGAARRGRAMHTRRKVSWSIGCSHRCSVRSPAAAVSHVGS